MKTHAMSVFLRAGAAGLVNDLAPVKKALANGLGMDDFSENKIKAQQNRIPRLKQDIVALSCHGHDLEGQELKLKMQLANLQTEISATQAKLAEKNDLLATMQRYEPYLKRQLHICHPHVVFLVRRCPRTGRED